jgi:puromycin-sensitive aminopeptidase
LKPTSINISKEDEVATFEFASELPVGLGDLNIQFSGVINNLMKGFYRSKYLTPEGKERFGAVTQFESVYARRAFPCWDEPSHKAKFDLTLTVPKDRVTISNMNVISETDDPIDPNCKVMKFATTPIMSTYLLAYVIGEYEYIEQSTKTGIQIRIYTPVGKTDQGKFALDVAVKALDFYEDYFRIPYPLPKLDLIAIADFSAGAMENWGLVTYRETALLYDPVNSATNVKQWIALVICHELAHQWFGNLVTMEWWTHLWLNEGFASFIEYLAIANLLPEYNIWQQFITDCYTEALDLDALHNSHAIEIPVKHPSEIEEIFDNISYNKGASVIRMLYHYIGDEHFRNGMQSYLSKWSYKNAITEDLWDSLEESSKKPIRSIMSTWTRQKGFPVVSVNSRQDGKNRVLTVAQEKFTVDGTLSETDQSAKWLIPISIISQNNSNPTKLLLETKATEVTLENVEPNDWVKLNPDTVAFFRVNYSVELLEQFQTAIVNQSLNPLDRLALQNDLFALVQAGKTSSDKILKLMESYVDEANYPVWDSINSCLGKFNALLSYTDYQEVFHLYGRKLLAKIYSKLGFEPIKSEGHMDALLRSIVISRLVSFKDPQVIKEAKSRFEAHVNKTANISPDLRAAIYRAVASDCDDKTFESMFTLYRESDLQEEKNRISRALGATTDAVRIQKVLDFAMSSEVRNQDAIFVIVAVASTKTGRDAAWKFFKENHEDIRKKYETGYLLCRLVKHLTENFASEERLQEVSSFFAAHPFPSTERTVQQVLESIKLNSDWLSRDSIIIRNYLTSQSQL